MRTCTQLSLFLTVPDLEAGNAAYKFINLEIDDMVTQVRHALLGQQWHAAHSAMSAKFKSVAVTVKQYWSR